MKKLFSLLALIGLISFGATGSAFAHASHPGHCYEWKKVCKPIYKVKVIWGTCYDKYGYKYQCKKKKSVKVGHTCKNKCVVWKPHKKIYKYQKPHKKIYKYKKYKKLY